MKKIYTLVFLLMYVSITLFAQKEAYTWAFGNKAGLDFNNLRSAPFSATRLYPSAGTVSIPNLPTAITTNITTYEGCFALSNAVTGQLMFYSDGVNVFRSNGSIMSNGTGLAGHVSSTQSGVLMPFPGNSNKYIALSINLIAASTQVAYSVIDMSDGIGKVLDESPFLKNTRLTGHQGILGESVNAIQHGNKNDFWIIAPGSGTNSAFNAWKVTKEGVQASTPVVSLFPAGALEASRNTYIKFSPDGKHFVWCNNFNSTPFWFGDFDNMTGEFSNIQMGISRNQSGGTILGSYSAEFSQSGKYLYVSTGSGLNVYDYAALAANPSTYTATVYTMNGGDATSTTQNSLALGSLQLGPDGYIYATYYDRMKSPNDDLANLTNGSRRYMILITNPENPTNLNIYRLDNFLNAGTGGHVGITSFSPSWFTLEINGEASICTNPASNITESYSINLAGTSASRPTELRWYFDADNSSSYTSQTVNSTDMTLSMAGSFPPVSSVTTRKIVVKAYNGSTELADLEQSLTITLYPAASVSASDVSVTSGSTATLTATASTGATISWYDSATGGTLLGTGATYTTGAISSERSFYVEATNPACSSGRQEVKVTIRIAQPTIDVSDPATICAGSTATLIATVSAGANAYWFLTPTGDSPVMIGTSVTTPVLDYTTTYYVEAQNSGNVPSERKAVKVVVNPCTLPVNPNIHLIN